MDAVRPVGQTTKEVRALDRADIQPFRDQIAKSGDQTLIDVTDLCLATGLRAGEALALRWEDVDLDADPPTLTVTGTVVYSKGDGNRRQQLPKTSTGVRTIQLPPVARELLQRRKTDNGIMEMVFPSERETYIWQGTFNARLRKARGEEFSWVTVHTLRKTLASLIADELGPHKAADVLGHADSRLTERVYYERNRRGVPIGEIVNRAVPAAEQVSKKSPTIDAAEPYESARDGQRGHDNGS
ncbi:site-specific integrase [Corynebacterium glaucum]|uniref:site-specific integrase n=1 Tax=Corynebacterium glaucum TaxID=187491 RepID=UPI00265B6B88|nr:site-specific integrase [Corynebacterium glaucum]